jgi:glucose/arabinose dehydrogenase
MKRVRRFLPVFFASLMMLLLVIPSLAQEATETPTPSPAQATPQGLANAVEVNTVITKTLPFDESMLSRLKLPEGFQVNVFASGLGNVRMMAVAPDGTLFVTRRDEGDLIAFKDEDGDGKADSTDVDVVVSDLPFLHGITFHNNQIYLANENSILVADWQGGDVIGSLRKIVSDLPVEGQHPNPTMAFGSDGKLYVTVGSHCNACREPNPENATILRFNADGSGREIFASGLRNTIGFGWHPTTDELWGMDQGSDDRGNDEPPEELNQLQAEKNYGWPYCYADQKPDLYIAYPPAGSLGREAYCQKTSSPILTYTAHSAPIAMVFYTAQQFPEAYRNGAFIAMRGSWNRNPPSG